MIELRARIRQELGLPCRGKDVFRVSGVMRFALFSLLAEAGSTRGGRRRPNSDAMEDLGKSSEVLQGIPTRLPTRKEAADSGATLEEAAKMPWFPTHATLCAGRPCRPGEGNLRGYKM